VLNTLVAIGPAARQAIPAVRKKLTSDDFHTQYWACRVRGAIGPEAAVATDQLLALVEHASTSVRRNAAAALGNIGPAVGAKAVPVLVRALADRSQVVREQAVIALGKLKPLSASAVPALEAALQEPQGTFGPRSEAAKTLWLLAPQSPLPAPVLIAELRSKQEPWTASRILGDLGPAIGVVDQVIAVLGHPDCEMRLYAAEALGAMGAAAQKALPQLEPLLQDEDEEVRAAAAAALRAIRAATKG
jgi:HEAT repeat protein